MGGTKLRGRGSFPLFDLDRTFNGTRSVLFSLLLIMGGFKQDGPNEIVLLSDLQGS